MQARGPGGRGHSFSIDGQFSGEEVAGNMLSLLSTVSALSRGPLLGRTPAPTALSRSLRVSVVAMGMSDLNDQGVTYKVKKTEAEWRGTLSEEEYSILRGKGTEYPGSGVYNK